MKQTLKKILPARLWNLLRGSNTVLIRAFRHGLEALGYTVARRKDYHSPLPAVSALQKNVHRWYRPSRLPGITYDLAGMKSTFSNLVSAYYGEFAAHPSYREVLTYGFGPGYTALDAFTLYAMLRAYQPRRYLEVGSGVSTYYCHLAAQQNGQEGHPLHIECIEPHPYKKLYSVVPGSHLHVQEVQDVDLSLFQGLRENDVLFIDSSHALKIDGDIPFLYLEVLPTLNQGVLIHIHDVPFPYNVPFPAEHWVFGQNWPMFWNEAMVVQAFLCCNTKFKIILSTPLLRHFEERFLQQVLPSYQSVGQEPNTFSSLWLQKVE